MQSQLEKRNQTESRPEQSQNQIKTNDSEIASFYSSKNVLITGATGFLGKVLLWKLLVTCRDLNKIYLLVRPKSDQSVQDRVRAMLNEKPFTWIASKAIKDTMNDKIVAIKADMGEPGLALSVEDLRLICDQVNVVFHSAASVKFDAPLLDNYRDNVTGTKSILELCDQIKHLDALVHVSTAYSNSHLRHVEERIYPLDNDVYEICSIIEGKKFDPKMELQMLEGRPNTYTYTKSIAENLVKKHEGKYPIAMVRPSIVISSFQEPSEGWVDNVNGIAGLSSLASIGILRTIDWNYYATSDMVPVDFVANCMICAARETSMNSPKELQIYNMTSGNMCPISWGKFFVLARQAACKNPTNKIVRPIIHSPKYHRVNLISSFMTRVFSELLFAYLVDTLLVLLGYKRILVKITKRMHHGYKILKPFTTREWVFDSKNLIALTDKLAPHDKATFPFDMRNFDWEVQGEVVWKGIREFIFKEESTKQSYASAKKRQVYVTIAHYILTSMFYGAISFGLYKLLV